MISGQEKQAQFGGHERAWSRGHGDGMGWDGVGCINIMAKDWSGLRCKHFDSVSLTNFQSQLCLWLD